MPRGRTIVFIDNSNVFHGQLNAKWRIDVRKLHSFLEQNGEIWQTFLFASVQDPPRYQQTNFYNFLKNEMRYEVLLYRLGQKTVHCRCCGDSRTVLVEKGVDVGLATRLLTLAHNRAFDTAILVAADRDYLETVRAVKVNGLRVEIVAWRGTISQELANESSRPVVYFDDIRPEIELTTMPDVVAEKLTSGEDDTVDLQQSQTQE
jgi:uncharacterized LabA/DUF88 family protein